MLWLTAGVSCKIPRWCYHYQAARQTSLCTKLAVVFLVRPSCSLSGQANRPRPLSQGALVIAQRNPFIIRAGTRPCENASPSDKRFSHLKCAKPRSSQDVICVQMEKVFACRPGQPTFWVSCEEEKNHLRLPGPMKNRSVQHFMILFLQMKTGPWFFNVFPSALLV